MLGSSHSWKQKLASSRLVGNAAAAAPPQPPPPLLATKGSGSGGANGRAEARREIQELEGKVTENMQQVGAAITRLLSLPKPVERLVEMATGGELEAPNPILNKQICDLVLTGTCSLDDVIVSLRQRLHSGGSGSDGGTAMTGGGGLHEKLLAVALLEAVFEKCLSLVAMKCLDERFACAVGGVLEEVLQLLGDERLPEEGKEKVLGLLKTWADAKELSDFGIIQQTYQKLKDAGVHFPSPRPPVPPSPSGAASRFAAPSASFKELLKPRSAKLPLLFGGGAGSTSAKTPKKPTAHGEGSDGSVNKLPAVLPDVALWLHAELAEMRGAAGGGKGDVSDNPSAGSPLSPSNTSSQALPTAGSLSVAIGSSPSENSASPPPPMTPKEPLTPGVKRWLARDASPATETVATSAAAVNELALATAVEEEAAAAFAAEAALRVAAKAEAEARKVAEAERRGEEPEKAPPTPSPPVKLNKMSSIFGWLSPPPAIASAAAAAPTPPSASLAPALSSAGEHQRSATIRLGSMRRFQKPNASAAAAANVEDEAAASSPAVAAGDGDSNAALSNGKIRMGSMKRFEKQKSSRWAEVDTSAAEGAGGVAPAEGTVDLKTNQGNAIVAEGAGDSDGGQQASTSQDVKGHHGAVGFGSAAGASQQVAEFGADDKVQADAAAASASASAPVPSLPVKLSTISSVLSWLSPAAVAAAPPSAAAKSKVAEGMGIVKRFEKQKSSRWAEVDTSAAEKTAEGVGGQAGENAGGGAVEGKGEGDENSRSEKGSTIAVSGVSGREEAADSADSREGTEDKEQAAAAAAASAAAADAPSAASPLKDAHINDSSTAPVAATKVASNGSHLSNAPPQVEKPPLGLLAWVLSCCATSSRVTPVPPMGAGTRGTASLEADLDD